MQFHDSEPLRIIFVGHGVNGGGLARAAFAVKQHIEIRQPAQQIFYIRSDELFFLFVVFQVGKADDGRIFHGAEFAAAEGERRIADKITVTELAVKSFHTVD